MNVVKEILKRLVCLIRGCFKLKSKCCNQITEVKSPTETELLHGLEDLIKPELKKIEEKIDRIAKSPALNGEDIKLEEPD